MRSSIAPAQIAAGRSVEEQYTIPVGYGQTYILLMVKDPLWIYAYWEIEPHAERAARSQLLPHEVPGLQTILRVYDVTDVDVPSHPAHRSFDISLSGLASNWYIHTDAPNRAFIVDIGLLTNTGKFVLLARSNRVTTPRNAPSDVLDEAWMTTDELYWKLAGATAGMDAGTSPSAWGRWLAQHLFSGNWSSLSVVGPMKGSGVKGFWCRVNTDLIIHGVTEPRSRVLIQGQPVTVRKDGTFSLRVALPPGTQTIAIDVTTPDGRRTQTITPIVTLAWSGTLTPEARASSQDARPQSNPSQP